MTLGWRPGLGAMLLLTVSVAFAAYVLSPIWWSQVGEDTRVFYAAGQLAQAGGNPYDPQALAAEEDRLYTPPGGAQAFAHATYANPPLFSSFLVIASRLPLAVFRFLAFVLLAVLGALGLELSLAAAGWRPRGWARGLMLSSSPMILAVFVGNTSPVLLAAWAGAWLAMQRRHPWMAGALLTLLWLKPSVGLLVAAALLVAGPAGRATAALTFAAVSLVLAAIDVVTTGIGPLAAWLRALTGYAGSLSSAAGRTAFSSNSEALAGLPGAFLDHLPAAASVALSAAIVGAVAWVYLRGRWTAVRDDPMARLAVAMSAVLAVSPYLHLNDLVLEAAPLMLVASVQLTPSSRLALTLWTAGGLLNLLVVVLVVNLTHQQLQSSSFGYGVVLNAATLVAVMAAARRRVSPKA